MKKIFFLTPLLLNITVFASNPNSTESKVIFIGGFLAPIEPGLKIDWNWGKKKQQATAAQLPAQEKKPDTQLSQSQLVGQSSSSSMQTNALHPVHRSFSAGGSLGDGGSTSSSSSSTDQKENEKSNLTTISAFSNVSSNSNSSIGAIASNSPSISLHGKIDENEIAGQKKNRFKYDVCITEVPMPFEEYWASYRQQESQPKLPAQDKLSDLNTISATIQLNQPQSPSKSLASSTQTNASSSSISSSSSSTQSSASSGSLVPPYLNAQPFTWGEDNVSGQVVVEVCTENGGEPAKNQPYLKKQNSMQTSALSSSSSASTNDQKEKK